MSFRKGGSVLFSLGFSFWDEFGYFIWDYCLLGLKRNRLRFLLLPKAGQVLHTLFSSYLCLEDKGVDLPLPSESVMPGTSNSFESKEPNFTLIYFLNYYFQKWAWKQFLFQREWDVTVVFGLRYLWFTPQHQNKVYKEFVTEPQVVIHLLLKKRYQIGGDTQNFYIQRDICI